LPPPPSPKPLLSPTEFASAVTAITSAFGDPTRREIYLFVHGSVDGVTAAEVAEHFDLHPNVARHHLDKLAGGGYVEVALARVARAGAGRPSKRYRATGQEMSIELPVRHDDVLVALLGRALSRLPAAEAEAMAEEVGVEFGRAMAGAMAPGADSHRSFRAALHAVADALTAHGFAAHAEKHGDQLRIVAEHCPFGGAAIEHPVICAVDRGMVRGMLESLVGEPAMAETALSLPKGDRRCVTAVQ
jgi:predicted ArsR family transcriptional regulator